MGTFLDIGKGVTARFPQATDQTNCAFCESQSNTQPKYVVLDIQYLQTGSLGIR